MSNIQLATKLYWVNQKKTNTNPISNSRIYQTQWMLLKSLTSWAYIHCETETGTFKPHVQLAAMVYTKVSIGCPINWRTQIAKFNTKEKNKKQIFQRSIICKREINLKKILRKIKQKKNLNENPEYEMNFENPLTQIHTITHTHTTS